MLTKVILAIDSFNGYLASEEVEAAVAETIRRKFPACEVRCLPVADGGEGMLSVLVRATGGRLIPVEVHDPLMRPIQARYGVLGDGETAVIEMAEASGLPLLTEQERNPMLNRRTDSACVAVGLPETARENIRRAVNEWLRF